MLKEQYAEIKAADAWGTGLARTELVTSDRTVLRIEVVIGDAGELEDPKRPYEFERGSSWTWLVGSSLIDRTLPG